MRWSIRNRPPEPVPLAPRHRPVWRGLRRLCTCGLLWKTCPDRLAPARPRPTNGGHW
jgi:hypothetical protein